MPLPADGLWTVRLAVTRRFPVEVDHHSRDRTGRRGSTISFSTTTATAEFNRTRVGSNASVSDLGMSAGNTGGDARQSACEETIARPATTTSSLPASDDGFVSDPTDWVSIRMGGTPGTLIDVACIKNVVNDDFGEVRNFNMRDFVYIVWRKGGERGEAKP